MIAGFSESWARACKAAHDDLPRNLPAFCVAFNGQKMPQHRAYQVTELHHWCLENQPRVILELGSGTTTFILARYATEFGARLVTIEENSAWRDTIKLPDWAQVQWFMSPVFCKGKHIRYTHYPDDLPEIDLLYVDGPNTDVLGRPLTGTDAVHICRQSLVKNILFDMRAVSVDYFRDEIGDEYGWEPGGSIELCRPWYLRPTRHHSWFWRK